MSEYDYTRGQHDSLNEVVRDIRKILGEYESIQDSGYIVDDLYFLLDKTVNRQRDYRTYSERLHIKEINAMKGLQD